MTNSHEGVADPKDFYREMLKNVLGDPKAIIEAKRIEAGEPWPFALGNMVNQVKGALDMAHEDSLLNSAIQVEFKNQIEAIMAGILLATNNPDIEKEGYEILLANLHALATHLSVVLGL